MKSLCEVRTLNGYWNTIFTLLEFCLHDKEKILNFYCIPGIKTTVISLLKILPCFPGNLIRVDFPIMSHNIQQTLCVFCQSPSFGIITKLPYIFSSELNPKVSINPPVINIICTKTLWKKKNKTISYSV